MSSLQSAQTDLDFADPSDVTTKGKAANAELQLSVVTPEQVIFEARAGEAVVPLIDGLCGILPGHAPLVARLGGGILRLGADEPKSPRFYVEGGFLQVLDDQVTILTSYAIAPGQVDTDVARKDREKAEAISATTATEMEQKAKAIARARAILQLNGSTEPTVSS